ncbi:MAG: hypothetical protein II970_01810 [Paludibacteraceae bacterium]|nr:hypothetical protein [Paludibacteraceae bacterium]
MFMIFPAWLLAAKPEIPDWVNPVLRTELYPAGTYYTGFSSLKPEKNEDKDKVYERVRQNARIEAVASIQVTVEQSIDRFIQNTQSRSDVSTRDIMTTRSNTQTGIKDIPGLKVELWENIKTGEVYAFAWVKKANLYKQLIRRTAVNLAKIENAIQNAEALAGRGEKGQAKSQLADMTTLFEDIENDQRVMLSIDASTTDEDLSLQETSLLKERFLSLSADLKNSIAVYIDCKAQLFEREYTPLESMLKGNLQKSDLSFTDSADGADWVVKVQAEAREYRKSDFGGVSSYFVYVDADVAIDKTASGKRVYQNMISEKGGHTVGFVQAAEEAYRQIAPLISEAIKKQIEQ